MAAEEESCTLRCKSKTVMVNNDKIETVLVEECR